MRRFKWTKEQDDYLKELIPNPLVEINWFVIHQAFSKRYSVKSQKQIKLRWENNLSPTLSTESWDACELRKLLDLYRTHGNKWKVIAGHFKGRTDNSVKNRFFGLIRKGLRIAMRLIKTSSNTCFTHMVNKLKPKVLSDAINKQVKYKYNGVLKHNNFGLLIERYAFAEYPYLKSNFKEEDRIVLESLFDMVNRLNEEYLEQKEKESNKKKRKRNSSIQINPNLLKFVDPINKLSSCFERIRNRTLEELGLSKGDCVRNKRIKKNRIGLREFKAKEKVFSRLKRCVFEIEDKANDTLNLSYDHIRKDIEEHKEEQQVIQDFKDKILKDTVNIFSSNVMLNDSNLSDEPEILDQESFNSQLCSLERENQNFKDNMFAIKVKPLRSNCQSIDKSEVDKLNDNSTENIKGKEDKPEYGVI